MTPLLRRQDAGVRIRHRQLRRHCESLLAELDAPTTWDIHDLCDLVAEQRDRRIHRVPIAMSAMHPCGFWIFTEHVDFIVYESDTSRVHQEHIIAHELAHIICCHRGGTTFSDATAQLLFPDLDPDLVRDMLRRSGYSDRQEQEAEMLASLIMEQANRLRPGAPRTATTTAIDDAGDETLRIARSLTYGHHATRR